MPWFWLVFGILMIWNHWRDRPWHFGAPSLARRQSMLVMAGVWIGWATMQLMDAYLPLLVKHIDLAFEWYQFIGLGGFMLLVGGYLCDFADFSDQIAVSALLLL